MRYKTRFLMVLVAIVAIALVTPGELRARRQRRDKARSREYCLRQAAIHEQADSSCRDSDGRRPYELIERHWALGSQCFSLPSFASWKAEAAWHSERAIAMRKAAAEYDREEKSLRRRLIVPVIFDIPRNAQ
jgi:hypothetical protein